MSPSYVITLLSLIIIGILILLAISLHNISKYRIARRLTVENMLVLVTMYGIVTIGFALVYFWLHVIDKVPLLFIYEPPTSLQRYFLDCLYFSVVTLFTVGYGDIIPIGLGRVVAILEVMLGYALSAALVLSWAQYMRIGKG
jgi:potassium channel LctB